MSRLLPEAKEFVLQFWAARAEILLFDRQPCEGYTPFAFLISSKVCTKFIEGSCLILSTFDASEHRM